MTAIIFDFFRTLYEPKLGDFAADALPFLQFCKSKGWKLGLISMKEPGRDILIEPITSFFDCIEIVDEKTVAVFQSMARRLGEKPEDVVVIGDRLSNEIKIGNSLGMMTFWLCKRGVGVFPVDRSEMPLFTFTSLEGIRTFLNTEVILK